MNLTESLISQIEQTFVKDDLRSAPRERLESLIVCIYDELNQARGSE